MQMHMKQSQSCEFRKLSIEILFSPLIRTNPVTGWKGLFTGVNSLQAGHINDVTEQENEILKDYCSSFLNASPKEYSAKPFCSQAIVYREP